MVQVDERAWRITRVHDMKLSIMALCGLLELEEGSIPPALKEGWASILPGLLSVFKQLPDAVNRAYSYSSTWAGLIIFGM